MITIHVNANKINLEIAWPGNTEMIEALPEGAKEFPFLDAMVFKGIKMLFDRLNMERKKIVIQALTLDLEKECLEEIYKDGDPNEKPVR